MALNFEEFHRHAGIDEFAGGDNVEALVFDEGRAGGMERGGAGADPGGGVGQGCRAGEGRRGGAEGEPSEQRAAGQEPAEEQGAGVGADQGHTGIEDRRLEHLH